MLLASQTRPSSQYSLGTMPGSRRILTSPLLSLFSIFLAGGSSAIPGCPTFSCGRLLNISYPFWLAENPNSPPAAYCGYFGLMLICQDQTPILPLPTGNYAVTQIDYAARTVGFADVDVFSDTACPWPRHNLSLGTAAGLSLTPEDANLTFFFNCSIAGPADHEIPCLAGAGGRRSYVFGAGGGIPEWGGRGACDEAVVAPVLVDELPESPSALVGGLGAVLRKGFKLGWPPESAGECGDCERSNGRCGYTRTGGFSWAAACFCEDGARTSHCGSVTHTKKKVMKGVIGGVMAAVVVMVCLLILVYLHHKKSTDSKFFGTTRTNSVQSIEDMLHKYGSVIPKRYKYSEVKSLTKCFSQQLGKGGYGSVFKGSLPDGRPVAVKVLSEFKGDGEEFVNEVASISRTSHVNIVSLLGFCAEKSKRALIYEFMPNGSLEKFIYDDKSKLEAPLGWKKLYDIAVAVARGLEYLHRGCNTRIVHLDIKPHNILLDQDFCPKISDFGLAKLCPSRNESFISMEGARGTPGYIAPEVFSREYGVVSSKSDVYSYGMMVLEMVGGRKNFDAAVENSSQTYFPSWIYDHIDDYLDRYCIPEISGVTSETKDAVKRMILVGLLCIQVKPADRPSMSQVVDILEGSTQDWEKPPKRN